MRPWPGSNGELLDLFYNHAMPLVSKNLWLGTLVLLTKCLIQNLKLEKTQKMK